MAAAQKVYLVLRLYYPLACKIRIAQTCKHDHDYKLLSFGMKRSVIW